MNKISKPIVGITTGDLNGIGLELFIKTFSDNRLIEFCTPVIFCSNKAINFYSKLINDQFKYYGTKDLTKINPKAINVFHCWEEDVLIEPGKTVDFSTNQPRIEQKPTAIDGNFPGSILIEALQGDHGFSSR